jgi:tryptophanyl-tRNA synthetase
MRKIILTGDRPTGKLHLGHYLGSLQNRVRLQDQYQQYIMVADVQALTDHFDNTQKITDNLYEVVLDYLAVGIDPQKTTIFIQSQVPEITELTVYYLNLVTLGRLERNPTVKSEIKQKGFDDAIPVGFLCYPVSQAADITIFKAECVPVGEDQLPMIEQTNEIVRKFNRIYHTDCLKETQAVLSHSPRLVGIDGKGKASKSLGNAIFLSDTPEEIHRKVFSMYTDPHHLKISDPGQIEGNVVFAYLDLFHPDQNQVSELKAHYQKGGLGDTQIKKILNQTLQDFLAPIRQMRSQLDMAAVKEIIRKGCLDAQAVAAQTMVEVRAAMGLDYFL